VSERGVLAREEDPRCLGRVSLGQRGTVKPVLARRKVRKRSATGAGAVVPRHMHYLIHGRCDSGMKAFQPSQDLGGALVLR